jgi:hypothetical protein
MDNFKDNPSAQEIMRHAINKSNRPINKYNFPLHQNTEALTGEQSDRTAYDVGSEMEHK